MTDIKPADLDADELAAGVFDEETARQSSYITAPRRGGLRDDEGELGRLLTTLADQVEAHPPSAWSPRLLQVVTSAIALEFGDFDRAAVVDSTSTTRLRLV